MAKAYFIIGSLLKERFTFGHHEAYLFPEFQIGNSYKADHLLVGRNSDGYHFVFVELEAPSGRISRADGSLGEAFRRGLSQVADWEDWLDARFASLTETFEKAKRRDLPIPSEFFQLDRSRIHFIVIAGRRADFNEKTYRISRKHPHMLLHYDNLLDDAREVIGKQTY